MPTDDPSLTSGNLNDDQGTAPPEAVSATVVDAIGPPARQTMTVLEFVGKMLAAFADASKATQLDAEILKLKEQIARQAHALETKTALAEQSEQEVQDLRLKLELLQQKERLAHLLSRVNTEAAEQLLSEASLRQQFEREDFTPAFVLSMDLRRSTELMLKAREPRLFAEFVMSLTAKLREVILKNFGVFDKFTGDGALAFFPEFFAGDDAGYYAVQAASECHQVCRTHFVENRRCFVSALKEVGLGIGIDYGPVQLVHLGSEFTVVGTPVVYACRMAGAPAGYTYVNQPAFEKLQAAYPESLSFREMEIDVKSEGQTVAYGTSLGARPHHARMPLWVSCRTPG